MGNPRVVVTITELDGTIIDKFTAEPTDRQLTADPNLSTIKLSGMIADIIQHDFETEDVE
jgi:hypothetical protein